MVVERVGIQYVSQNERYDGNHAGRVNLCDCLFFVLRKVEMTGFLQVGRLFLIPAVVGFLFC